ncbi:hypothetical protein KR093_005247 [Drosophila rubida]|uniref:Lipase domain-containing protein n=1 Tax=Drosophila rubida TaxID=30044 RepID=A0AAD4JY82_9MUSC|nr:hypothetical protein KR093_005247 [Drosophila rubida]
MAKTILSWLPLLCQLGTLQALSLDSLAGQSSIYYQQPGAELLLQQVEQLSPVSSLKLIVHGFLASRSHSSISPLRNAYAAQGYEHVLVADWSPAANLDYPSSRRAVQRVAVVLAKQLQLFLAKHSVPLDVVHVLGHSLGAHIAGRIGQHFNGSLGRITGLDPALPLFSSHSDDSLQAHAARFVDVIHTDYPVFGDLTPRGSVDFYPNFGHTPQPGCEELDLLTASKLILEAYSCSHNRAVSLYAESIGLPKSFPAIACSWKSIRSSSSCAEKLTDFNLNSTELDDTQLVYMGEQVARSATSYYYLETNAAPPYGQGMRAKFA